jgi:hypothetical protein
MKKMIVALMILAALAGCTDKTPFGECIGAFDDKKPELEYKLSVKNVVLATIFFETAFVPVIVIAEQTHCPVGAKKPVPAQ